ncbi:MAG: RseA family anti-sigma factor [Proteobacteria bacterium]|nr:RseA family anti-sigma factor [Pseudomonadota bacterium]MDA0949430.1 RseA family anti-sigma factor [Pseudomonadota bacterium]MDA1083363.1 RseA family anti-sigma factor [Pseudomonadota bacterium]
MTYNLEEKLSALYDGELDANEVDGILDMLEKDVSLQKKLSQYALVSSSVNNSNNIQSIATKKKPVNYGFWFSNAITAAATVLLTFVAINQLEFSRMGEDISAKNQLNIAMSSKEAKDIVSKTEENLVDHVMHVINNPDLDNDTPYDIDLRNVGYNRLSSNGRKFNKGDKNFILRIEKKNLGINKVRYWRHGDKIIHIVPLADGRVVTIYGNIDAQSAIKVANSIGK